MEKNKKQMVFIVTDKDSTVPQILKPKLPCLFRQKSFVIKLSSDSLIGLTLLGMSSSSFYLL